MWGMRSCVCCEAVKEKSGNGKSLYMRISFRDHVRQSNVHDEYGKRGLSSTFQKKKIFTVFIK